MDQPNLKSAVIEQADKIGKDCERAAIRDSLVSTRWRTINLLVGLAAVSTGAVATAVAGVPDGMVDLGSFGPWIGMVAALLSSILASILTFLKPSEIAADFRQYSFKYQGLRDRIRLFVATGEATHTDDATLLSSFEKLLQEKQEVDAEHPVLPQWAYKKAKKIIEEKALNRTRQNTQQSPQ